MILESLNGIKFLEFFLFTSPNLCDPDKNIPEANYDDIDNNINSNVTIIRTNAYWELKFQAQFFKLNFIKIFYKTLNFNILKHCHNTHSVLKEGRRPDSYITDL